MAFSKDSYLFGGAEPAKPKKPNNPNSVRRMKKGEFDPENFLKVAQQGTMEQLKQLQAPQQGAVTPPGFRRSMVRRDTGGRVMDPMNSLDWLEQNGPNREIAQQRQAQLNQQVTNPLGNPPPQQSSLPVLPPMLPPPGPIDLSQFGLLNPVQGNVYNPVQMMPQPQIDLSQFGLLNLPQSSPQLPQIPQLPQMVQLPTQPGPAQRPAGQPQFPVPPFLKNDPNSSGMYSDQ